MSNEIEKTPPIRRKDLIKSHLSKAGVLCALFVKILRGEAFLPTYIAYVYSNMPLPRFCHIVVMLFTAFGIYIVTK